MRIKILHNKPFYLYILTFFTFCLLFSFTLIFLGFRYKGFNFFEILYFSITKASFVFLFSTSMAFIYSLMRYQHEKERNVNKTFKKHLYSLMFSLSYLLIMFTIGYLSFIATPRKQNQYIETWEYTSIEEFFLRDTISIMGLILLSLLMFFAFYYAGLYSFSKGIFRIEITRPDEENKITQN